MGRLRDFIHGSLTDLAFALVGRRAANAPAPVRDADDDRLRSTLASIFNFESTPPDEYLEVAARRRVALLATLGEQARDLGEQNVALAFEADGLRRQLADREHQLLVARRMLREEGADRTGHYLWEVTADLEGGGLEHAGDLPGEVA